MRIPALFIVSLCLVGCVQFPEIDDATSETARTAPYPKLIPLDPIADILNGPGTAPVETEETLEARVAGLRSRADRLRAPVLSANDRARLEEKLQ